MKVQEGSKLVTLASAPKEEESMEAGAEEENEPEVPEDSLEETEKTSDLENE